MSKGERPAPTPDANEASEDATCLRCFSGRAGAACTCTTTPDAVEKAYRKFSGRKGREFYPYIASFEFQIFRAGYAAGAAAERERLDDYLQHLSTCRKHASGHFHTAVCTCGLDKAREGK